VIWDTGNAGGKEMLEMEFGRDGAEGPVRGYVIRRSLKPGRDGGLELMDDSHNEMHISSCHY